MSEEVKKPNEPAEGGEDRLKNIQSEMNRKLGNIEDTFKNSLTALTAKLESLGKPQAAAEPAKKVSVFDDEEEFAAHLETRVEQRLTKKISEQNEMTAAFTTVTNQLYAEYPELNDQTSELAKRANEIYTALPAKEKSSPLALKAAVAEAASEHGIKPKSKRKSSNDDSFSLGSSGARPAKKGELDSATEQLARLVGLDMDDKARRERMANNHGRKSYKKYE